MSVKLSKSERASKLNMQQTSNWTRPLWSRNLRLRPSTSFWAWESPWWKTRKLALTVAAKTYLQRLSIIWTSPLSDANRFKATNQFAFLVFTYPMWTQQWPLGELQSIDRETRKLISENGGRHPLSPTALLKKTSNQTRQLWSRNLTLGPSTSSRVWESPWWKTRSYHLHIYSCSKDVLEKALVNLDKPSVRRQQRLRATNSFALLVLTYPMWN